MARKNDVGKKFALGALAAAAGGYLAGILTAPKSGKATRADIADKTGEAKDAAADQLQSLQDELDDLLEVAKDKSAGAKTKGREELNEAVLRAKDARSKSSEILKAVKKGQAEDPELNKAVNQARQAIKNLGKYLKK